MARTKAEVQAMLHLDELPDDEFMALLAELGENEVVAGPPPSSNARAYTPDEIEQIVITGTVGALLAEARRKAGESLAGIATRVNVTRTRVQQIEQSENIEITTLVRIASACGYQVHIDLRPTRPGQPELHAVLAAAG